jgi:hypothetical protein
MEFHQPNREAILLSLVPERKTPEDLNPELDNLGLETSYLEFACYQGKVKKEPFSFDHTELIPKSCENT